MPMIKTLPAVNVAAVAAQTGVKLGETPFFLGGNYTFEMDEPMAGAISLALQSSPDNVTWTTIRTINAAQSVVNAIELTDAPRYFRTNVLVAGTAQTLNPILRGVQ